MDERQHLPHAAQGWEKYEVLVRRLVICGVIWTQMSAWRWGTRVWEVNDEWRWLKHGQTALKSAANQQKTVKTEVFFHLQVVAPHAEPLAGWILGSAVGE